MTAVKTRGSPDHRQENQLAFLLARIV